jgi:hypothetical protein
MVEWYQQEKLLIRQPELSGNHTSSKLETKQEDMVKDMINFALRSS